jgi:hypothetical protein
MVTTDPLFLDHPRHNVPGVFSWWRSPECPLWVRSGRNAHEMQCLLHPRKRTLIAAAARLRVKYAEVVPNFENSLTRGGFEPRFSDSILKIV